MTKLRIRRFHELTLSSLRFYRNELQTRLKVGVLGNHADK